MVSLYSFSSVLIRPRMHYFAGVEFFIMSFVYIINRNAKIGDPVLMWITDETSEDVRTH